MSIGDGITPKKVQTLGIYVKQIVYKWYNIEYNKQKGMWEGPDIQFADKKVKEVVKILLETPYDR